MSPSSFILDQSKVFAPKSLLTKAKNRAKIAKVVIAFSHSKSAISGAKQAFDLNLIEPIFVGPKDQIEKQAISLSWDISWFRIINETEEEKAGDISALLCGNGEADILMKGDLHSDTFMRSVIAKKNNLRTKNKIVHQFYITNDDMNTGIMVSDAAVNIKPSEKTLKTVIETMVKSLKKLGIKTPKIAFLSASEIVMENIVSVGEGYAGFVITRSTLNRNGLFITSGLYDSGYHGVMAGCLHVRVGPAKIKKGTRVGQFILFEAETLSMYDGSYGIGNQHDNKYGEISGNKH